MTYATQQDLETRFGADELLQVAAQEGGIDDAPTLDLPRVEQALSDTAAIIDGYLAKRYILPVLPVPALLQALACDIARYKLRNRNEGSGNTSDIITDRYKDALKQLCKISDGSMELEGLVRQSGPGSRVQFSAPAPVFSRQNGVFKGWL